MTCIDCPDSHADDARQALRQLAHATRHMTDPTQIYPIVGDLSNGLASLAQSLHQIAAVNESLAREHAQLAGDVRAGRAASYQASWGLHRAAEMLTQTTMALDEAHELEASIAYDLREADLSIETRRPQHGHGGSL